MEQWKEYRLGEICKVINGRAYKQEELLNEGKYKVLRVGNIFQGNKWYYSDLELPDSKYCYNGDLLYAWSCDFAPYIWHGDKTIYHYHIWKLEENKDVVDRQYLYYYLQIRTKTFLGGTHGSVMLHMTKKDMEDQILSLPSLSSQKRIASILSSLDDTIALNRKINSNLEEQAKALFKSWFIDFEPFKDGKFVDSELGKIPEGWKVGRYDDIVSATVVGDWGKDKPIGNYVHEVTCIRGCDFQDIKNGLTGNAPSRFILEKNFKNKCFANNDILVEISGGTQTVSTGRVCPISQELISRYNGNVVCTNFCRVLRPIEEYSAFIYYSWLYKYNHKVMFGYENGTSGIKNFRLNDFLSMEPLIIPPKDKVAEFQKVIDTINAQMQTTGLESSKLVETRDSLLPRLMSGEIDVRL